MINWQNISDCLQWYTLDGFIQIDVPWIIPEKYNKSTHNYLDGIYHTKTGTLIGSAEQSFVMLDHQGQIDRSRNYISCSPCFRSEQKLDDFHKEYFMKCELYIPVDDKNDAILVNLLSKASDFFKTKTNKELEYINTPDGYDINLSGIEIGSYGYREYDNIKWYYGTAIAEPRFSKANDI